MKAVVFVEFDTDDQNSLPDFQAVLETVRDELGRTLPENQPRAYLAIDDSANQLITYFHHLREEKDCVGGTFSASPERIRELAEGLKHVLNDE